jgi:hypothetical protein
MDGFPRTVTLAVLACCLLAPIPLRAGGDPGGSKGVAGPAFSREMEEHVLEHLAEAKKIAAAAEREDLAGVAAYLLDECCLIKRYAVVKLMSLGLPDSHYQAYLGAKNEEALKSTAASIKRWIDENPRKVLDVKPVLKDFNIMRELIALITQEVRYQKIAGAKAKRRIRFIAVLCKNCKDRRGKAWIADVLLGLMEKKRVLTEAGITGPIGKKEDPVPSCEKLLKWYLENRRFCYFHPAERRLKIDHGARKNNVSS